MTFIRSFVPAPGESWLDSALVPLVTVGGIGLGAVLAYLAVAGMWHVALALLFALPIFVLLHRYPFAAVIIWLLLTPFVVATYGGVFRRVYWMVHRALPAATVAIVVLSYMLSIHRRRLPRLGLPELAMAAYIVVSLVSVIYFSDDLMGTAYNVYDRVFVPMCLYFIIRLTNPSEKDLKRLLPVFSFILLSQTIIGLISWVSPDVLPEPWLDRVGTRTTGSLAHYSVYTSTLIFCALLLLQSALNDDLSRKTRFWYIFQFLLGGFMIFFSFSRGSWLAGVIAAAGLTLLYPKKFAKVMGVTFMLIFLLLSSGLLNGYIEYAQERFYSDQSEQTALSRLPVMYASYRMFEAKPLIGWGYGNFDKFDFQFQERIGNLVAPEKDHASHNFYLTILSEQGLAGFLTFLAPALWWLIQTVKTGPRMPAEGFWSRKLVWVLWLVLVFHFVVNNFSNMRVVFGLGMWWVALGLIASIVSRYQDVGPPARQEELSHISQIEGS